jgi:hypothetical protein
MTLFKLCDIRSVQVYYLHTLYMYFMETCTLHVFYGNLCREWVFYPVPYKISSVDEKVTGRMISLGTMWVVYCSTFN